jgi:hypothetical protein
MTDRNSNKESQLRLIPAVVTIRSKLCLYTNLYKYFQFIPTFHVFASLKTVEKRLKVLIVKCAEVLTGC